jgi:hypothetical protein
MRATVRVRPPGKEVPAMTGSALAVIVIPIVMVIALAAWLAMIFYADAHPRYVRHGAASGPRAARGDEHGQGVLPELALTGPGATGRKQSAAVPGGSGAHDPAPAEPGRQAA